MTRYFLTCCLILAASGVCSAQQNAPSPPPPAPQRAGLLLDGLPDQIKSLDEPALRVFLHLQAATFLWADKSSNAHGEAETLAEAALADLAEHGREMPQVYANSFRGELLALVELHAPSLAARLKEKYGAKEEENPVADAVALLDQKDGAAAAVAKMQGFLKGGRDPQQMMIFFLQRLELERPEEVAPLLAEMLGAEERAPGSISFDTLFFLKHQYMKDERPAELKARFLGVFVRSAQAVLNNPASEETVRAHGVLSDLLPTIQKLRPALYPQAAALAGQLAARLPKLAVERDAADERIARSQDPLAQTLTEAEATSDASLKDSLYAQAARLALKKGQLKTAVESMLKVASQERNSLAYRDQFMAEVVDAALRAEDPAAAALAASKILSPFRRSSAAQRIAIYFFDSGDIARARETLDDALKLVQSAENGAARVSAIFEISGAFIKVDEQRVPELTRAAVKALNELPTPKAGDKPGSEARNNHVRALLQMSHRIIPVFRSLAQKDAAGTLALADGIQSKELKVSAIFGASTAAGKKDESTSRAASAVGP